MKDALDQCTKVAGDLKDSLTKSEKAFKRTFAKAWWEKIRVVQGKKSITKLVSEIERAKTTLLLAQQNASSIAGESHRESQEGKLKNISRTVELTHNANGETSTRIEAKIDDSADKIGVVIAITKATEQQLSVLNIRQREANEAHVEVKNGLHQISDSQSKGFRHISDSLGVVRGSSSISAKLDRNFDQGQEHLIVTNRIEDTVTGNSEVLNTVDSKVEQLLTLLENPATMVGLFTQALVQHDRERKAGRIVEVESEVSPERQITNSDLNSSELPASNSGKRLRWKRVSYKRYINNQYLSVGSITRKSVTEGDDGDPETSSSVKFETCISVRSRFRFSIEDFSYTKRATAWDPLYEAKVRFVETFDWDSAIWKACWNLDLDEIRRLFVSGQASPFMENEYGVSLPEQFIGICGMPWKKCDASLIVSIFSFLIEARGSRGSGIRPLKVLNFVRDVSLFIKHLTKSELNACNTILRLILERSSENPLDHPQIPALLVVDVAQNSLSATIAQQCVWPLDLQPRIDDQEAVCEGPRQMLEDPKGDRLMEPLEDAERYYPWSFPLPGDVVGPVWTLLNMISETSRTDLQECCNNRIKLLTSTPRFHRLIRRETLDFDDIENMKNMFYYDYSEQYIGRHAIRNNTRAILEEVFLDLGWKVFDIDDFFDKETYYCVPDLIDGKIIHETARQTETEFIRNLCEGCFFKALKGRS